MDGFVSNFFLPTKTEGFAWASHALTSALILEAKSLPCAYVDPSSEKRQPLWKKNLLLGFSDDTCYLEGFELVWFTSLIENSCIFPPKANFSQVTLFPIFPTALGD